MVLGRVAKAVHGSVSYSSRVGVINSPEFARQSACGGAMPFALGIGADTCRIVGCCKLEADVIESKSGFWC